MLIKNKFRHNCKKIMNHYGLSSQLLKTIEELDELREAIFDFIDKDERTLTESNGKQITVKEHLIEEMADVEVMLFQLEYALDCTKQENVVKLNKTNRQLKRIKEEGV